MYVYVCVSEGGCVVCVCMCVLVQALIYARRPEKDIRSPAESIFNLLLLSQGLSWNRELGWQPASSLDALASAARVWRLHTPGPAFYKGSKDVN